jgi:immune inhibitor A
MLVGPSPELMEKIKAEMASMRKKSDGVIAQMLTVRERSYPGLNDGLIYPGDMYPLGTSAAPVRSAALDRSPLKGTIRAIVVLVQFSDKKMTKTKKHYEDLFFSTGIIKTGSVREYYREVSNNIVDIVGEVVGPYTLPKKISEYAHGESGLGKILPNARTMARHAVEMADKDVNFSQYDNDNDGFVDAFIVIHAGPGAEVTGNANDIWSHKSVIEGSAYSADGKKVYAYNTVPEDAKIGVCCHELGHLLFGFPDLYDTDYSSEGVGNWCLMSGGNWNGSGDTPAHPSAWCKANQEWVTVVNPKTNGKVSLDAVETSHTVYRLAKDGASGKEYFLLENRQKTLFDSKLPGAGLLIWHIDENIANNSDENHPKVALEQADGKNDLLKGTNRGDGGDPYPGTANNISFTKTTTPGSKTYGGVDTCISVNNISPSGPTMTMNVSVSCIEIKFLKENLKDTLKEYKTDKNIKTEIKEVLKDNKNLKDIKDSKNKPYGEWGKLADKWEYDFDRRPLEYNLESRLEMLESRLESIEPFINAALRPDLREGALLNEEDLNMLSASIQGEATRSKRRFLDTNLRPFR